MPSQQRIRVLIVDDFADTRDSITKLLYFEHDIEIVGSASDAQQGIKLTQDLHPDVILMDINMPGMDGIAATEAIYSTYPSCEVIMMSVQGEADYLRRAMLAGAREYLVKPFTGDELANSIRQVYEAGADKRARLAAAMQQPAQVRPVEAPPPSSGKVISVFSPKGGVGKTTIAVNLAVAIRALTGKKVALADCSLLFGDVGIMLNLPAGKTISELIPNAANLDSDILNSVMVEHNSGVKVLMAPARPELAELIHPEHVRKILGLLKAEYDYVVVDTQPTFEDTMLAALDLSDQILALTTLEMPAIKNMKLFLEVAYALHYSSEKLMLVLNRADSTGGIDVSDIEQSMRFRVSAKIVSDGQIMTMAVNQGIPAVVSHRESVVARNIFDLAAKLLSEADAAEVQKKPVGATPGSREGKSGFGIGKYRLLTYSARKE